MSDLLFSATENCPGITFKAAEGTLLIAGESYSEEAAAALEKTIQHVRGHLDDRPEGTLSVTFALIYFNSSSARKIMTLMTTLDEAAEGGADVRVAWHYRPGDESMAELGEDFGEDLEHAAFSLVEEDS